MKVVHVSLCSYPYISSWGYQENWLIEAHHKKGHEVVEITSGYIPPIYREHLVKDDTFNKKISYDKNGTKIIRLKYLLPLPFCFNHHLRLYKGLYEALESENPDVIFVHDMQFLSLFTIKKYAKAHLECIVKADTHVSEVNSVNNIFSNIFLHRIFYKWIICSNYKIFQKIYCIARSEKTFIEKYYNIKETDTNFELLPLGGNIISHEEANTNREKVRKRHNLGANDLLFVHSGKMERSKRTHEILEAFYQVKGDNLHMFLIGSIPESQKEVIEKDIQRDKRVLFIGWKNADELREYLYAADAYIQLGSQSSTLQAAICAGCPCILNFARNESDGGYTQFFDEDVAFSVESKEDVTNIIEKIKRNPEILDEYSLKSQKVAHDIFDYDRQVEKIIHDERK